MTASTSRPALPSRTARSIVGHRPDQRRSQRRLAVVFALLLGLVLTGGCGGSDTDNEFTDADSGSEIRLASGDQFSLRLESNPTTGYSWTLDDATLPVGIELQSSTYVADEAADGVVGAGGSEVFVFDATGSGAGIVRLTYVRPFEDDPVPARVVEYIVRIDDAPWPPADGSTPGTATAVAPDASTE